MVVNKLILKEFAPLINKENQEILEKIEEHKFYEISANQKDEQTFERNIPQVNINEKKSDDLFDEQQIEQIKKISFKEGYDKAIEDKEQKLLQQSLNLNEILEKININLAIFLEEQNKFLEEIKSFAIKIAVHATKKIFNNSIKENDYNKICEIIQNSINLLEKEIIVKIDINKNTNQIVGSKIFDIIHNKGLDNKFLININNDLKDGDCFINWNNGSLEYSREKLLEKIISKLESL